MFLEKFLYVILVRNSMKREIFILGIVLVVLSFIFDNEILNFFILMRNFVLDKFMVFITLNVTLIVALVLVSIYLLYLRKNKLNIIFAVSAFISYLTGKLLKFLVMRARPGVNSLVETGGYGMPSVHAMVVFSVYPMLYKKFRRLSYFWLIFALLVSFSRVYVGVHYLSDVVVGGLLGYLIGAVIFKKWK